MDRKGNRVEIPAVWQSTKQLLLSTCLVADSGEQIRTIEHLMAAFYETGIDNINVEVDCNEIPVMDGSAISFINVFL